MRLSESFLDMDMANYSEALDPSYAALEFENVQLLYNAQGMFQLINITLLSYEDQ